ncbi:MAG: hypothetical protein WC554_17815 [Clostridia bacterium]
MKILILETTHSTGFGMIKTENYKVYYSDDGQLKILVDNKEISKYAVDEVLRRIFSDAIDMGAWKHSWHMDVSKFHEREIRDKIKKIILEKQEQRELELEYLRAVERVLMTQEIYEKEE